ncbi:ABC transporter ATP-binding protein [Bacillus sp. FJAT-22090]|uniref:ABC transporter ATP-binding protein n=1 Tax=Bacillus sp. FJAT-22090 TaxID=1581038 RepID=UPI0006AF892C|nr:ATP-binding cassette domain-containing protein [Bacillus sp. FJAT-22090]
MTALLEIKNITKNYWDMKEAKCRLHLFENITVVLQKAERIALLGKSGEGKSTLLRTLALFETLDKGEIYFKGDSAKELDTRQWRMNIAYVAQQSIMLLGTIEDNLKTVSKLHNIPFDEGLAKKYMKDIGLEHLMWNKKAKDLSGGEKQRVALVRTLLLNPPVLLLDEITASLDQQSKEYVELLLEHIHKEKGTSFIWITHDLEQAKKISDRVWYMENGRLAIDSRTEDFFESHHTQVIPDQVML